MKAVFFDIDNTLHDSTTQVETARSNAVDAMIEAGLPINKKKCLEILEDVVESYGSNYEKHFNVLMKRIGIPRENYQIIAAGIVAYHNTKISMLHPFPDTIPTLLKLRNIGLKLGVITQGKPVKQWEKLIRLGLQHFFDEVIITDEVGLKKPSADLFRYAAKKIGVKPEECVMVGDRLDTDIEGAKKVGMKTVRVLQGKYKQQKVTKKNKPDYTIKNLSSMLKIIRTLK
jgi:putative hydrolase of the HAD superfamily